MTHTPLHKLSDLGQSIWLDYINRSLLESGRLKKWIDQGLRGMTSNPSIFNQVISTGRIYDESIAKLRASGKNAFEIYDALTISDIQEACDQFQKVYQSTEGLDGYVSLEINPQLANTFEKQWQEGARLFQAVDRPNVMIKVPATKEGLPVVEELIAQGINVNVTLIFSLRQYVQTVERYLKGLKRLSRRTSDLKCVRSVASVFVSRIDTLVDKLLDEKIQKQTSRIQKEKLEALKGKAAVANCRIIFEKFKELFAATEFKVLERKNANLQRVLWGSTSTKNPLYSDIKYVSELIASPSINTVPEETLNAFLDHGVAEETLTYPAKNAELLFRSLSAQGIDINMVCAQLLTEGVTAFDKAFVALLGAIEKKANELCAK